MEVTINLPVWMIRYKRVRSRQRECIQRIRQLRASLSPPYRGSVSRERQAVPQSVSLSQSRQALPQRVSFPQSKQAVPQLVCPGEKTHAMPQRPSFFQSSQAVSHRDMLTVRSLVEYRRHIDRQRSLSPARTRLRFSDERSARRDHHSLSPGRHHKPSTNIDKSQKTVKILPPMNPRLQLRSKVTRLSRQGLRSLHFHQESVQFPYLQPSTRTTTRGDFRWDKNHHQ